MRRRCNNKCSDILFVFVLVTVQNLIFQLLTSVSASFFQAFAFWRRNSPTTGSRVKLTGQFFYCFDFGEFLFFLRKSSRVLLQGRPRIEGPFSPLPPSSHAPAAKAIRKKRGKGGGGGGGGGGSRECLDDGEEGGRRQQKIYSSISRSLLFFLFYRLRTRERFHQQKW